MVMTYAAGPTMTCRVTPIVQHLRERGVHVTVYALSEAFPGHIAQTQILGEPVYLIGQTHFTLAPNGTKLRFGPLRYFREVLKTSERLLTDLRKEKIRVVQVFTTDPGALLLAIYLRAHGLKVLLDVDDSTYGMGVMAGYPKPVLCLQWFLENVIPRFFKTLSTGSSSRCRQYPGCNHLPIPIKREVFARSKPPCNQPIVTVIMVGTMATAHLHLQVIEIIPEIVRKNKRIRFCFIGTGERLASIRERVATLGLQSFVELPGYLSREETIRRMCEADIGICPVGNNPFDRSRIPMKILEYMAAGLCVVSAPIGDIPEFIRHLENGWLYRPDDMGDFAQAILGLADQPNLVQRLAHQAKLDSKKYEVDQVAPIWFDFYQKAAQWKPI